MPDQSQADNQGRQDDGRRNPPTRFGPMLLAIGPGIVVTGSVIGSGELINTPVQAAKFGFDADSAAAWLAD